MDKRRLIIFHDEYLNHHWHLLAIIVLSTYGPFISEFSWKNIYPKLPALSEFDRIGTVQTLFDPYPEPLCYCRCACTDISQSQQCY